MGLFSEVQVNLSSQSLHICSWLPASSQRERESGLRHKETTKSTKMSEKKSKAKEGTSSTVQSVEWDSNKSSSHCILCKTAWGTFYNRRHHCRNCGRLVCENCSAQKFVLTNSHGAGGGAAGGTATGSGTSGGNSSDTSAPQRVCDTCYEVLKQKREMKIQVVQLKDRNLELMLSTSLISDSLINVFFLDGSTKTIGIDETTTVKDLAALACPAVQIALFEVVQNIQAVSQYKLLAPTQNIVTLTSIWQQTGQPYIKIVVPLNNPSIDLGAVPSQRTQSMLGRSESLNSTTADATHPPLSLSQSKSPAGQGQTNITSPMKSIYKVKPNPPVGSPIYLATSADTVTTVNSTSSNNKDGKEKSPPASPTRRNKNNNSNNNNTNDSRNSSFSDTDASAAGDAMKALHLQVATRNEKSRDVAAELINNQIQIGALKVN